MCGVEAAFERGAQQAVDADEKCSKRFAGACGRGDQSGFAAQNGGPAGDLRLGGAVLSKFRGEPLLDQGVRPGQRLVKGGCVARDEAGFHDLIVAVRGFFALHIPGPDV